MIEVTLPDGRTLEVDTDDPNKAAAAAKRFMDANPLTGEESFSVDNENVPMGNIPPARSAPEVPATGPGMAQADMGNILSGFMQGTSPVTRDIYGENIRPALGTLREIQDDSGLTVYGFDGPEGFVPIARQRGEQFRDEPGAADKYVVMADPNTGQPTVYQRTEDTDEGMAAGAGRMMAFGITGAVPGGTRATMANAPSLLRDFQSIGVTPNIPAVMSLPGRAGVGGEALGTLGTMVQDVPVVGTMARAGSERLAGDLAAAGQRLTEGATSPMQAGRAAQEGITEWNRAAPQARTGTYPPQPLGPGIGKPFRERAAQLYDRAWQNVPAGAQFDMTETLATFDSALNRIDNPELAKAVIDSKIGKWAEILRNANGRLSARDAKQFRTFIREARGDSKLVEGIDTATLKRLEGALTEDIFAGFDQYGGRRAVVDLRRADRYYGKNIARLKTMEQITGANSTTQSFDRLLAAARGKGGRDAEMLQNVRKAVGEDTWREIVTTMLDTIGQAKPGQGEGFSPRTFLTEYRKLTPQAKAAMLDSAGMKQLRVNLESYARAVEAWDKSLRRQNISRSGGAIATLAGLYQIGSGAVSPTMAALVGSGSVAAGILMSPRTVGVLNRIDRLLLSGPIDAADSVVNIQQAIRAASSLDKTVPSTDELYPAVRELQATLVERLTKAAQQAGRTPPPSREAPALAP